MEKVAIKCFKKQAYQNDLYYSLKEMRTKFGISLILVNLTMISSIVGELATHSSVEVTPRPQRILGLQFLGLH